MEPTGLPRSSKAFVLPRFEEGRFQHTPRIRFHPRKWTKHDKTADFQGLPVRQKAGLAATLRLLQIRRQLSILGRNTARSSQKTMFIEQINIRFRAFRFQMSRNSYETRCRHGSSHPAAYFPRLSEASERWSKEASEMPPRSPTCDRTSSSCHPKPVGTAYRMASSFLDFRLPQAIF